jgi:hypothetical protein
VQISSKPEYSIDKTRSHRLKHGKAKQIELQSGTHYVRFALDHNYGMFMYVSNYLG